MTSRVKQDTYEHTWQEFSLCGLKENQHLDFYEEFKKKKLQQCAELCAVCPVKYECFETAQVNKEQHGVWGGHFFEDGSIYRIPVRSENRDLVGRMRNIFPKQRL